jgi:4-amino-4-deoxy-L-arabinose transferase-like glycosyltransferase
MHSSNSQARTTWTILAAALIARLIVLAVVVTTYPRDWLYNRGIEMGLLANSLIHGLGYSSPFGGSTGPTAFIAPGYPTLIAAIFLTFGSYTFASAIAIMLLQVLVSVFTVWLIMCLARETHDAPTANLAGAFWAISLPLLWIPTIFWETSISACVFPATIALALRCRRTSTIAAWVLLGAACAVASLINPALLPSLLAIMGWTAFHTLKASRTAPLLGFVALLLVFSPWPIRNAYRFHAFIPTRTTVGFELWMGNRPGATGYLNESLFPMYNKQELASYISEGELAYTNGKSAQAVADIRAQPTVFLKLTARRFVRFWTGTGNLNGSPIYAIHALLTTGLGLAGLTLLYRRRRRDLATLFALPLLLFPLPYYITHAEFRYRLNIDPLLTILAAYALTQFASRFVAPSDAAPPTPPSTHSAPRPQTPPPSSQ